MRYTAEHTDPADIRIAEGSTSMTGALMAAAMASYDLSCGLIDDEHIGRYSDVITALEERMGVGAGGLSVQTEAGELIANAKEDGISVGINIPGGKCADIAFVDADPAPTTFTRHPFAPSPTTARGARSPHRRASRRDMVLDGQMTAETPRMYPPISPRLRGRRQERQARHRRNRRHQALGGRHSHGRDLSAHRGSPTLRDLDARTVLWCPFGHSGRQNEPGILISRLDDGSYDVRLGPGSTAPSASRPGTPIGPGWTCPWPPPWSSPSRTTWRSTTGSRARRPPPAPHGLDASTLLRS
ncbi:MAG: hypothetical protein ACLT98_00540 [Eggerthellaceae bacterium]